MNFRLDRRPPFLRRTIICHKDAWLIPPPADGNYAAVYQGGGGLYLADRRPDPWQTAFMRRSETPAPSVFGGAVSCDEPALFCGMMKRHFGHFLAEAAGRFWALETLGPNIPLVYLTRDTPAVSVWPAADAFFGLTEIRNPVRIVREPTRFRKLWAAEDLMQPLTGGATGAKLKTWLGGRLPRLEPVAGPDIYLTRSGTAGDRGRILGEAAIEAGLLTEGYQVLRPETLPLASQISAYIHARRIIASESSALHLMSLVVRPGTQIAIIRRRPVPQVSIGAAAASFPAGECHLIHAIRTYWGNDQPGWMNFGIAGLDFPLLWNKLMSLGFIGKAGTMPVPTETETEAERLGIDPLRSIRFDVEPGVDYVLQRGQGSSPDPARPEVT